MYTVKQLSQLAGVTTRTLRYYDEIGLLKPSRLGRNGYRYYGPASLLTLQQILFYRELDVPLEDIGRIVGQADFDLLGALQAHKLALQQQGARLRRLVATVDHTIVQLQQGRRMHGAALFAGFHQAEQGQYAREAEQRYGAATVRASARRWAAYDEATQAAVLAEGDQVYADLVAVMPAGAASAPVQQVVERWRRHLLHFWTPALAQLNGLADTYRSDARFKAKFDALHPQLAEFMVAAVQVYVAAHDAEPGGPAPCG